MYVHTVGPARGSSLHTFEQHRAISTGVVQSREVLKLEHTLYNLRATVRVAVRVAVSVAVRVAVHVAAILAVHVPVCCAVCALQCV